MSRLKPLNHDALGKIQVRIKLLQVNQPAIPALLTILQHQHLAQAVNEETF